jgi:hypothetical protein
VGPDPKKLEAHVRPLSPAQAGITAVYEPGVTLTMGAQLRQE